MKSSTKERWREAYLCYPRAVREFFRTEGLDGAASLSYYMVLAMFPGLLALISLLTLVGASEDGTEWMLEVLNRALAPNGETLSAESEQLMTTAAQLLTTLSDHATGTTLAITVGSLGALWSTSAYVTAFGRSMNRLFKVSEGRPQWKRRPQMFFITLLIMILAVVTMVLLAVSGSVAMALGNIFGLGDNFVTIVNLVKPLALLVVFLLVLALLYYFTPNVKRPTFQWFSPGTITALIILGLSVVGFSFYLSNFATYSATYGTIGGLIVLIIACWVSNIALIFGALVDIEFIRLRQLRTGMPAAEVVQLPIRDSTLIAKKSLSNYRDLVQAQDIRIQHGGDPLQDMQMDPSGKTRRKTKLAPVVLGATVAWLVSRWVVKRAAEQHVSEETDEAIGRP
ncbi:YihY/virulence factor BrkB family protein [Glutamicibacter sp. NPDC087344]|uniref:YihY/virulence factor BrkB family protein n=1 Tax=Glutamicibacter sp. NPDC087344 TaxID=3363994 RepID=UPI0038276029